MKISDFKEQSHIDSGLIDAVIEHGGGTLFREAGLGVGGGRPPPTQLDVHFADQAILHPAIHRAATYGSAYTRP